MKKLIISIPTFLLLLVSVSSIKAQCFAFTGLAANYCTSSPTVTLTPNQVGGAFSGAGILGNTFNPALAGVGPHTITYTINTGGCVGSSSQLTNVTANPVMGAGPDVTICSGQSTTLNGTSVGAASYFWSPAAGLNNVNILNPIASPTVTTTYTLTGLTAGGVAGTGKVKMRSTAGQPWGVTTDDQAMNNVFGVGGWQDLRYELNPANTVFVPTNRFIWLEGGDNNGTEMETYFSANQALIESWVASGGSLFLNQAPNEDNGMSYGFGGIILNYPNYSTPGNAAVAHAIFTGPYLPVGVSWTANYFSHSGIAFNPSLNVLITGSGYNICAEKMWGSGRVIFGGMTATWFHSPATEALNLRQNIIYYLDANASGGACMGSDNVVVTVIPGITISPTALPTQSCAGSPVTLTANVGAGNCNQYTMNSIPHAPQASPLATNIFLGDDQVSGAIPIPFTFNFFCNNYTNVYVSSNGFLGFDPALPNGCCSGQPIPTVSMNNFIAGTWNDLYPPGGGSIDYFTNGVSPNRIFTVRWNNIPHYPAAGPPLNTFTIQLYETTNNIQVHLTNITDDGSTHTCGIQDATGLNFQVPAGKNGVNWTSLNEAYLFAPVVPLPYVVNWQAPLGNNIGTGNTLVVSPGGTTTYYAIVSNGTCSAQGQITVDVSSVNAGPDVFLCPSGNVNFNAIYSGPPPPNNCNVYTVANIPFAPVPGVGTPEFLGDDQMSGALPVGFTFQFYCNNYTQFYLSSNGFIEFSGWGNSGCCGGQFLPNFGNPTNLIAAAWDDLYPPGAGSVNYFTTGVPPNRKLIVNWTNIPYCCGNTPDVTTQLILYETTNIIEVHNTMINGINPGTQGIEDLPGAVAVVVPGRNSSFWSTLGDAYRFTPQVGALVWNWAPPTFLNVTNVNNPVGTGINTTTTYTVTVNNGTCILTDQVTVTICLPVDNVQLTGTKAGDNVALDWNSFNEIQLDHYIVERAIDGTGWKDIGSVTATGGIGSSANYSLMDNDPGQGTNYYRLRLVNEDGSIEYSNQVEVMFGTAEYVKVSPNPGKGNFNFEIGLLEDVNVVLNIYSTEGKKVYEAAPGVLSAGVAQLAVDITSLSDGVYYYFVTGSRGSHSGKLVIER